LVAVVAFNSPIEYISPTKHFFTTSVDLVGECKHPWMTSIADLYVSRETFSITAIEYEVRLRSCAERSDIVRIFNGAGGSE